jgi:hypothetical protein
LFDEGLPNLRGFFQFALLLEGHGLGGAGGRGLGGEEGWAK